MLLDFMARDETYCSLGQSITKYFICHTVPFSASRLSRYSIIIGCRSHIAGFTGTSDISVVEVMRRKVGDTRRTHWTIG